MKIGIWDNICFKAMNWFSKIVTSIIVVKMKFRIAWELINLLQWFFFSRMSVFTNSYNNNKTGEIEAMNCFIQRRFNFLNIDICAQTVPHRSFSNFEKFNHTYSNMKSKISKKIWVINFRNFLWNLSHLIHQLRNTLF